MGGAIIVCIGFFMSLSHAIPSINRPALSNDRIFPINKPAKALRLMSFNIKMKDEPHEKALGVHWAQRTAYLSTVIESYKPDIVGLQEFVPNNQLPALNDVRDLTIVSCNKELLDSAIVYRHERLKLLAFGDFFLSKAPLLQKQTANTAWENESPRGGCWALLNDKLTGHTVLAMTVHFAHGFITRKESSAVVMQQLSLLKDTLKPNALVLLGDFNFFAASSQESEHSYQRLIESGLLQDVRDAAPSRDYFGPDGTWLGFRGTDPMSAAAGIINKQINGSFVSKTSSEAGTIDMRPDGIFVGSALTVLQTGVLDIKVDPATKELIFNNRNVTQQGYPSDHLPVIADIIITE